MWKTTEISYFNFITVAWPQQALVRSTKIHVSYVKCEHNRSSEQLARHSKVTLTRQENKDVSYP